MGRVKEKRLPFPGSLVTQIVPALPYDQILGNVQPEPEASAAGAAGIRNLVQMLKNSLCLLRLNTASGVGDFYEHHAPVFLVLPGFDRHRAASGRKLNRVIQ